MNEHNQSAHNEHDTHNVSVGHKEKNTGMAIIAYIIFFVPLLTDAKNDPFVKFHVKQGLVLFIAIVVLNIIVNMLRLWSFMSLPSLVWLIFAILGIINASNGKMEPLPGIGKFADNFKF